jgi:hypothetical protein
VTGQLPPGWPSSVLPPGAPGWTRSASAWLFDLCPPDYRAYDVLRAHPLVLARLADEHLHAAIEASRHGLATARADLRDLVSPEAVGAALTMYERECARLTAARRSVDAVGRALRGEKYVPRL